MAKGLITQQHLEDIADAIRAKLDVQTLYKPEEMAAAIQGITTGFVEPLNVTENGTYTPPSGVDGYAPVTVNVSGGGDILSGTTPPASSLGNDGDVYKRYFSIPSDVTFVEYLKSSGTQYIDTGIIADQGTDVVCDCEYNGNNFILGCRSGSASSASKSLMVTGSSSGICAYKSSKGADVGSFSTSTSTGTRCKAYTETKHDGSISRAMLVPRYDVRTSYVKTLSDFTADYSQVLFGIKQGSTPSAGTAKLFRVTYFQYGSPIADYIPCLDGNGVACMWDNIAGEYVYNDGTGDFAYGSTVTPDPLDDVYYLKENGAWHVIQQ